MQCGRNGAKWRKVFTQLSSRISLLWKEGRSVAYTKTTLASSDVCSGAVRHVALCLRRGVFYLHIFRDQSYFLLLLLSLLSGAVPL